jgi:hypothetical protein
MISLSVPKVNPSVPWAPTSLAGIQSILPPLTPHIYYEDGSRVPRWLEFGLLNIDQALWIVVFDNQL